MPRIKTVKIKIWGIVQGVGFRPFVAKLADRFGMRGEVLNIGGLVDIVLTDTQERIEAFLDALKKEKPLPAEIVYIRIEEQKRRDFKSFTILDSDEGDDEAAMIPADLSICPDCLEELRNPLNPRYMHPFISCMVCGPRYTIIDKIPYDRENTAMIEFPMCDFCRGEYTDRDDRRYHAQTVSCHDCGPMLNYRLSGSEGTITEVSNEDCSMEACSIGVIGIHADERIIDRAVMPVFLAANYINEGKIIALKGVGGYNFICSPFDETAVINLRRLKVREEKPFAVMFRDIDQIKEYCYLSSEEETLLQSSAKPIVLLERRSVLDLNSELISKDYEEISPAVYKTSRFIGAFLPSMGVQHMLIDFCGPIIVTSANLSDMPIINEDQEMFALQDHLDREEDGERLLAAVFYNERKIRIRLDDSVVRVIDGQPQMIRRSKGYAPVPLYINERLGKEDMILAMGGQLKASFALSKGSFSYISQYFGDLDSREAGLIFKENIERMAELFRMKPNLVVSDLHPLYFTTNYAEQYAKRCGIDHIKVQHHHAHVASVMAEHDLKGAVIGVSFDGTGYGTDGAIWGGEFLICEDDCFERAAHLEYIRMLGGDSSMKEGWKSAFSYLYHYQSQNDTLSSGDGTDILSSLREPVDLRWPMVKAGLHHNINTINSSSMGRLFDSIAAYAGIHDFNRYEGECAIMLENAAVEAIQMGLEPWEMHFEILEKGQSENSCDGADDDHIISARTIFQQMQVAQAAGIDKRCVALGFHDAAAEMICLICNRIRQARGIETAALTGGVFQNKILMEKTLKLLRSDGFSVYYNVSVGPNDGGVCLGQNYIGMKYLTKKSHNDKIDRE
ncbi:carbamoyltransferase HypF [Anoxybacterium hadale]|uniref:Carbamoyltransferase HypF n=1 Tax=Anoxybacterium hadale TaxID=3408580 RepID=A0ACD1ABF4_9FIRM|nr:carbamoyltransferase HypF [Clostridiales bacterium]